MGQISIGTPIDTSLIRCCSCRKGYDIKGNIYENNLLVCPYCGLKHKIDFTLIDKKIDNLIKIDRLNLGAIDIGSAAIDRTTSIGVATLVDKTNPSNASGTITQIELWAKVNLANCQIATFFVVSGNNLSTRDIVTIGAVTAGSKQTFTEDSEETPISLSVEAGDYIGIYFTSGEVSYNSTGVGFWYVVGDKIPCTNQAFDYYSSRAISVYGIGATAGDFTYTGTGSFTYSGAAEGYVRNFTYTGSGALIYSGTATQVYTTDFLYVAGGSLTFSGEGSYTKPAYEYEGSGEFAYSGSAVTVIGFTYAGAGELTYSGAATQSHTKIFLYVASGDFTFSGVAAYSCFVKYFCIGSGTYSFSSVGTYILGFASVGSGVLVYSGAADFPAIRPANIYYLVSKAITTYYERTIPVLTSYVVNIPSTVYYKKTIPALTFYVVGVPTTVYYEVSL